MGRQLKLNLFPQAKNFPVCAGDSGFGDFFSPCRLFVPLFPPVSFLMLLHLLQGLAGIGWTLVSRIHVGFFYDDLLCIVLHSVHVSTDGLAAKPVGNQAEVRQAILNVCLQDRGWPVVPVGCSVLFEKVSEFFTHLLCGQQHVLLRCHLIPSPKMRSN